MSEMSLHETRKSSLRPAQARLSFHILYCHSGTTIPPGLTMERGRPPLLPSPNPSLNRVAKPSSFCCSLSALEIRTSCRSRGLCLSLFLWLLASSSLSPSCQSALSKTRARPRQSSALNAPDPPVAHECGYGPGTLTSGAMRRRPSDR